MTFVKVKNSIGTSNENPPSDYKSWLGYWEKIKNKTVYSCSTKTETKTSSRTSKGSLLLGLLQLLHNGTIYLLFSLNLCTCAPSNGYPLQFLTKIDTLVAAVVAKSKLQK